MTSWPKVQIEFDVSDTKECMEALHNIAGLVKYEHGAEFLKKVLSPILPPKSISRKIKNVHLMVRYVSSGLGVEKCAAMLAKENESLPRHKRHGPYGTTDAGTMEKQIKRQKKLMAKDHDYRGYVEREVAANKWLDEHNREWDRLRREGKSPSEIVKLLHGGTFHNKKSPDISN